MLLFSRTAGFRHASIPDALGAISDIATEVGITVESTEDPSAFTADNLARFAAVAFVLTTGDILDEQQEAAFEGYIRGGGGFVGIHSAADTEYDWSWYGELLGTWFASHPPVQEAQVIVEDQAHPSTRCLPQSWPRTDEWYDFRSPPAGVSVLLSVDVEHSNLSQPHAIAWYHHFDGGRAWYTAMGHTAEGYAESAFRGHLAGGILWAAAR